MAAGDFIVRRNNAETTNIPDVGTDVDVSWDTEVKDKGGTLTYSGGEITVPDTGPYLIIYNEQFNSTDTDNNERVEIQGIVLINGSPIMAGRSQDFMRKAQQGCQECTVSGATIVELTASDTIQIRFTRTDTSTDTLCNRTPLKGGFQVLQLDDTHNYGIYSKSTTTAFTTTFTDLALDTNLRQDTGFSRSGGTITISNAGRYLVTVAAEVSQSSSTRNLVVSELYLDTVAVPGTRSSCYIRGNDGTGDGALSGIYLLDVATDDDLTMQVFTNTTTGTPTMAVDMEIAIWQLPSDSEEIIVEATTGDINAVGTFTWDTSEHIDTDSFTHTAGTNPIEVDEDNDYLFLSTLCRANTVTVTRALPEHKFAVDATEVQYGTGSTYIRETNTSRVGLTTAAILPLTAGEEVTLVTSRLATTTTAIGNERGQFAAINLGKAFTSTVAVTANLGLLLEHTLDVESDDTLSLEYLLTPHDAIAFGTPITQLCAMGTPWPYITFAGGTIAVTANNQMALEHIAWVALDSSSTLEHILGLELDKSLVLEHLLEFEGSTVLSLEHILGMRGDGQHILEHVLDAEIDSSLAIEHILGVEANNLSALEHLLGFEGDNESTLEHILGAEINKELVLEHIFGVEADDTLTLEHVLGVTINKGLVLEHILGLESDDVLTLEHLLEVAPGDIVANKLLTLEHISYRSIAKTQVLEHIVGVASDKGLVLEHLLAAEKDSGLTLEHVLGVEADKELTLEHILGIKGVEEHILEHILGVEGDNPVALEHLLGFEGDNELTLEHLLETTGVTANNLLTLEHILNLSIDKTQVLEHIINASSDKSLILEHLVEMEADSPLALEHLLALATDRTQSLEHILSLETGDVQSLEHILGATSNKDLALEYLGRVDAGDTVTLEHLLRVDSSNTSVLEHVLQASSSTTLSVEHLIEFASAIENNLEHIAGVTSDDELTLEHLLGTIVSVTSDNTGALEHILNVSVDSTLVLEHRQLLSDFILTWVSADYPTSWVIPACPTTWTLAANPTGWVLGAYPTTWNLPNCPTSWVLQ